MARRAAQPQSALVAPAEASESRATLGDDVDESHMALGGVARARRASLEVERRQQLEVVQRQQAQSRADSRRGSRRPMSTGWGLGGPLPPARERLLIRPAHLPGSPAAAGQQGQRPGSGFGSRRRSSIWGQSRQGPELTDLARVFETAVAESARVDAFVMQPAPAARSDDDDAPTSMRLSQGDSTASLLGRSGRGAITAAARSSSWRSPTRSSARLDSARRDSGTLLEGYLLRRTPWGRWGRRYFVLTNCGRLTWYASPDALRSQPAAAAGGGPHATTDNADGVGQIWLRFFATELRGGVAAEALGSSDVEDIELRRMLPSCAQLELRSGSEVLQLAWHRAVLDDWMRALTSQCLLNYPKSAVFSDKSVPVSWSDDMVRVLSVGEGTTANDVVKRLCRSRRRREHARAAEVPLVHSPTEWCLFERQRHESPALLPTRRSDETVDAADARPGLSKLPPDEPIVDQVLLRWEMAMRREYGPLPVAPRGAFELLLRKVRGPAGGVGRLRGVSAEEKELEVGGTRPNHSARTLCPRHYPLN